MSLKLGKIRTETRSWRKKWQIIRHYFFNMRNVWKTRPDSYTITIKKNVQFQVGIYHEKFQLDQSQNCQPASTFDFNLCNNWKIARALLLNKMCCFKLQNTLKFWTWSTCRCRPAATFDFNMFSNWKIMSDFCTCTIDQKKRFQAGIGLCPEKFQLN